MHKIRFRSIIATWTIASALLLGCDPDEALQTPTPDYFPLRVGDYRIYHVQETQVTAYNVETALEYDLKTVVVDSFETIPGIYSYLVSRYKRATSNESWTGLDTWTVRSNDREVVVTEGSTPFVRLTFPIKSGRAWNGNAYNNLETGEFCSGNSFTSCDQYEMTNIGAPFSTTVEDFENTVEIIQNNDPDLITRYDIRKEVYAANIGLIFKESVILNYCTIGTCLGQQLVENGVKLKQELVEYGHD